MKLLLRALRKRPTCPVLKRFHMVSRRIELRVSVRDTVVALTKLSSVISTLSCDRSFFQIHVVTCGHHESRLEASSLQDVFRLVIV